MESVKSSEAKTALAQHVETLKEYAKGTIIYDVEDRDRRVQELFTLGQSFGLTEKEVVKLLYGDLLMPKRGCECPSCRSRRDQIFPN